LPLLYDTEYFDPTLTRGHTVKQLTGLVMDYEVLSKFCSTCAWDENSDEFNLNSQLCSSENLQEEAEAEITEQCDIESKRFQNSQKEAETTKAIKNAKKIKEEGPTYEPCGF
ncbi:hypothetical protein ANN_27729, partial [Periplaneta americana]